MNRYKQAIITTLAILLLGFGAFFLGAQVYILKYGQTGGVQYFYASFMAILCFTGFIFALRNRKYNVLFIFMLLAGMISGIIYIFAGINVILKVLGILLTVTIAFRIVLFVSFSSLSWFNDRKPLEIDPNFHKTVTILQPCFNEEKTLANATTSLIGQDYKYIKEIIIINDGSKDATLKVANRLASKYKELVRVIDQPNSGKASALNNGLRHATGEIIFWMDADAVFVENTVSQLMACFQDNKIMAASGKCVVANKDSNFLTRAAYLETMTGIALQTRTFSQLRSLQVIPGCLGAAYKDKIKAVGGFPNDTIVEDMDLTLLLQKKFGIQGYKIMFNNNAVAFFEQPETLKDFLKQRYRWVYGWYQIQKKHRDIILNPKYGILGMFSFQYFIIEPYFNIIMIISVVAILATAFSSGNINAVLYTMIGGILLVIGIITYAILLDGNIWKNKKYILYIIPQNIFYLCALNYTYLKAAYDFRLGKRAGWNKVARLGKNTH